MMFSVAISLPKVKSLLFVVCGAHVEETAGAKSQADVRTDPDKEGHQDHHSDVFRAKQTKQ